MEGENLLNESVDNDDSRVKTSVGIMQANIMFFGIIFSCDS